MSPEAKPLPRWREHSGHRKIEPLERPGGALPVLEGFLSDVAAELGRDRSAIRVLDIGCGRGALVSRLLAEGWDAWGADISPEYVEAGRVYFDRIEPGSSRIGLIDAEQGLPFDDKFDAIVSTETIEHVEDLDKFCELVASASKPGTRGYHQWPGKWRPIESHMLLPCVHWLPKGRARRVLIKAELAAGLGAPYFKDEPLDRRAQVFCEYSDQETFYRSTREIRATFARYGTLAETSAINLARINKKWPWAPKALQSLGSGLYGQMKSSIMTTRHTGLRADQPGS